MNQMSSVPDAGLQVVDFLSIQTSNEYFTVTNADENKPDVVALQIQISTRFYEISFELLRPPESCRSWIAVLTCIGGLKCIDFLCTHVVYCMLCYA